MSFTIRNNFEKPVTGTLPNTWGEHEAAFKDRVDEATDGAINIPVNGNVTLAVSTGTDDQVHYAGINIIGGVGGSITLPMQQGMFVVYNGSTGDVTIQNGGTVNTVVHANQLTQVFNDGINAVRQIGWNDINPKDYADDILIQAKQYTDNAEFSSAAGSFPGQAGNAGKFLTTDNTVASWATITTADVQGISTIVTDIDETKALAISLAVLT